MFKISTFELVQLHSFVKKQKCLNFGSNIPFWGIYGQKCLNWVFLDWNSKTILSNLKSALSNLFKCKISRKIALFGYFWARALKILSPYLKLAPWSFSYSTILRKNKNALFECFWATISSIIFWDFPMFYQIFFSPKVKRCAIFTDKHGIYELIHELPNDLRLRS